MNNLLRQAFVVLLLGALIGCAATPRAIEQPPSDQLQGFNRAMFRFNDGLDRILLKPAARFYRAMLPHGVRRVVGNVFDHWTYPPVIANDLLQGKFSEAGRDTARFALNTVMGIGGLFDVATPNGLPARDEDFGQTLALWGVPSGPYLVLPLLGPATLRDAIGRPVDSLANPYLDYVDDENAWELHGLFLIDQRAGLFDAERQMEDAYDRYLFLRDAYVQRRNYLIFDGEPPLQDPAELEDEFDYEIEVD